MDRWDVNGNISQTAIGAVGRRGQSFVYPESILAGCAAAPGSWNGPRESRGTCAEESASRGQQQVHASGASRGGRVGHVPASAVSARAGGVRAAAQAQEWEMA
jgi:hypothetical protein